MSLTSLLRPDILTMQAYKPIVPFDVLSKRLGRDPRDIIKLDANENPYGPSPRALAALAQIEYAHIYPDPENTALRAALARHTGLPLENLFAGSGSDEIIDLIMRLFLRPGDAILDCPPTFGMFTFDAAVNGAKVVEIPRRADFSLDITAIESFFNTNSPNPPILQSSNHSITQSPLPKLLFLASPNNPTGNVLPDGDLCRLLDLPLPAEAASACPHLSREEAYSLSVAVHHLVRDLRKSTERGDAAALALAQLAGEAGGVVLAADAGWLNGAGPDLTPDQVALFALDPRRRALRVHGLTADEAAMGHVVDAIDTTTRAASNLIYAYLQAHDL